MGWFGNLQLAYKYAIVLGSLFTLVIVAGLIKVIHDKRRLDPTYFSVVVNADFDGRIRKFVKAANLEATGTPDHQERVELNKREPDEGDLFGIRAIQSGFFGGVAQSRPSSLAESNSPDGSSSNTLLGSHASPKFGPQSPASSVTTLPLEARRSSPLAHKAMSSEDLNASATPKRRGPTPLRTTLAPSDAELGGRLNHDPAVNMSLEIPPSPVTHSRPRTVYSDTHDRAPSGYYSSPHNGGQYAPLGAPQIPEQFKRSSARPVSTTEPHPEKGHHSQSASLVSATSDRLARESQRSITPSDQSSAADDERRGSSGSDEGPRSRGREDWSRPQRSHPPRSSSRYSGFPQTMPTIHSQEDEVIVSHQPHAPNAVGDWGDDIFKEIDQSLQESRSLNIPSNSDAKYNHHTSTLSDASSTYSTGHTGHRGSGRQISIDSKLQSEPRQSGGLDAPVEFEDSAAGRERKIRESDGSIRDDPSVAGSHRNPKEFGDIYDSYGRRNGQTQASGNQNLKPMDIARNGQRATQMDLKPETIREVPSPLPSPSIGKAM
ncbi:MAG: hypothetical protein Q9224_004311 [Gallowayella concinna]